MYLRTLGHPALLGTDGTTVHKLRKKDLALLVYLCVEGTSVHARGRLASLLWGESPEEAARHSLTQALSRLGRALPPGSLVVDTQVVGWGQALPCDAVTLLRGGVRPEDVDDAFPIYEGEFLHGFHPRPGAEEFLEWADRRRADLRNATLRLLELAGDDAEAKGRLWRTVKLAEKAVRIDPLAESARRRLMRAWAALGERNIALRHYHDFADWLHREMGAEPDPDTRALAELLRTEAAESPPVRRDPAPGPPAASPPSSAAPPPRPADPPRPERTEAAPGPPAAPPAAPEDRSPAPMPGDATARAAPHPVAVDGGTKPETIAVDGGTKPESIAHDVGTEPVAVDAGTEPAPVVVDAGTEPEPVAVDAGSRPEAVADDVGTKPEPVADDPVRAPPAFFRGRGMWIVLGALLVAAMAMAVTWGMRGGPGAEPEPVGHGESLRERGASQAYLAFAETLYAYPDTVTLRACTGRRTPAIRQVRSLPPWPRVGLPSVRWHPWMGDTLPVVTDAPHIKPAYVSVGCVLAGVPDPPTLDSIFGTGALARMLEVPHAVLEAMPTAFIARGHRVRPAGTLIRSPDGILRWITYHGGALSVADSALLATWCRSPTEAVDVSAAEFRYYRPYGRLHRGSMDCG